MVHKVGAHIGGIRTVEDLRQRCRIDAETGCWRWGLACCQGSAVVHLVLDGRRLKMRGRRAALVLARGRDLPAGHSAFAKPHCPHDDCVNPEHARSGTRDQLGEAIAASGIWRGLPSKIKASRKTWDKRGRTLTPEIVAMIRSSPKSNYALAIEIGCSQYAVWCVRAGVTHKDVAAGASVFTLPGVLAQQERQAA